MITNYYVKTKCFDDLNEALKYAEQMSMFYEDEDICIKKVEITDIKTFRNGGELGL